MCASARTLFELVDRGLRLEPSYEIEGQQRDAGFPLVGDLPRAVRGELIFPGPVTPKVSLGQGVLQVLVDAGNATGQLSDLARVLGCMPVRN
jgi:hypothetical protein